MRDDTKALHALIDHVENSPWGNAQPDARLELWNLEQKLAKLETDRKKLFETLSTVHDHLIGQDVFGDTVLLDARVDEVLKETKG